MGIKYKKEMMAYIKIKGIKVLLLVCLKELKQFCDVLDRKSNFYAKVM